MKTLNEFVEEACKEFEKEFDHVHLVESWGSEDCLCDFDWKKNKCAEKITSFFRAKLLESATLTASAVNVDEKIKFLCNEDFMDNFDDASTYGYNAALQEIETKSRAWFEGK